MNRKLDIVSNLYNPPSLENKYYYIVLISRKQLVSRQFNTSLMPTTITMALLSWKCLEVETIASSLVNFESNFSSGQDMVECILDNMERFPPSRHYSRQFWKNSWLACGKAAKNKKLISNFEFYRPHSIPYLEWSSLRAIRSRQRYT